MNAQLQAAWRTVVPDLDTRHGPLPPALLVLTVVTGLVDAFSYLVLGHVFVANMTGNVIFLAFSFAGAPGFSAWAAAVSLLAFAAGALGAGRVAHRRREHRGRVLAGVTILQTVLVIAAAIVALMHGAPWSGATRYLLIALLALAMGAQNATARALAVPDLTTTVLTLTITGTAADSTLAGGADSKAGRRLLSVAAMFVGALAGGLVAVHGQAGMVLLIATVLLVGVSLAADRMSRSRRDWIRPV